MTRRLISSGSPLEELAGYSRAVVDGEWVIVSGTTGFDYAGGAVSADPVEPAERTLHDILPGDTTVMAPLCDDRMKVEIEVTARRREA